MDTSRRRPRALTAFIASTSAALISAAPIGCSSNGSSFGSGTGGTSSTGNTTQAVGGSDSGTQSTGGDGNGTQVTGGSGSNETQAMGGSSPSAGTTSTGGAGTVGGAGPQGGQAMTGGTGGTGDGGPVCPKPAGEICHEFLANDNSRNVVNYVNEFTSTKPGGVVWSQNVNSTGNNSPRTIEFVDNPKASGGKAILVSINEGYVELDPKDGKVLVTVKTQFNNVTGACRLPDGTTALGTDTTPAQIRIVNSSGTQSRSFNLPAGQNLRAINRDPATGHFWLSRTENIYEISDQGQILWQGFMGAGTKGYAVWWRAGGGAYGTTGEPATVVEVDAAGKIVQTIGGRTNFPALNLDFFSGFVRRPNGNYIVANWLGHLGSPGANTAEVIEFQPDGGAGKVVWQWGNQTLARQITNVYVFR